MSEIEARELLALNIIVDPIDIKVTLAKDPAKPYVGLENIPSRGSHLLNWGLASSSISTNSIFSAGDVLFGKLRPNLRKCVIAPFDGYCSTDILVLRSKDGVHPGFIGRVFQTERVGAAAEKTAIGTKMPRTSWKHLSSLEVFCPKFPEQSRIAQILGTLDTAIRNTEIIIVKLKAVKQGLLHDLLTCGINANGEIRTLQRSPGSFRLTSLGFVPKGWKISTLGAEFTLQRGFDITEKEQKPGDIPVVSSSGVTSYHSIAKVKGPGVVTGRKGKLGKCYYIEEDFWPHDTTLWVNNFHGNNPEYGYLLLNHLRLERFDAATSVPTLNRNFVHPLTIPVPPIEEQELIVREANAIKRMINSEASFLGKLRATKSGLMDDLLTGRVRVTPLLERAGELLPAEGS